MAYKDKKKQQEASRKWLKAHPEVRRAWYKRNAARLRPRASDQNLFTKYRLRRDEFDQMVLAQKGGLCAICWERPVQRLTVDHDHRTGVIRGLLCNACNRGLAAFRDNPETLERARVYLNIPHAVAA